MKNHVAPNEATREKRTAPFAATQNLLSAKMRSGGAFLPKGINPPLRIIV